MYYIWEESELRSCILSSWSQFEVNVASWLMQTPDIDWKNASVKMSVCRSLEAHLKTSWWLMAAESHKSEKKAEFLTLRWHSLCQPWNKDVAEQEVKESRTDPPLPPPPPQLPLKQQQANIQPF